MSVTWFNSASITLTETSAPFSVPIMTIPNGTIQFDSVHNLPFGTLIIAASFYALPGNWTVTTTPAGFTGLPDYRIAIYDDTNTRRIFSNRAPFPLGSTLAPWENLFSSTSVGPNSNFVQLPVVFSSQVTTWDGATGVAGIGGGFAAIEADSLTSSRGGPDALERVFGLISMLYTTDPDFPLDGIEGVRATDSSSGQLSGTVDLSTQFNAGPGHNLTISYTEAYGESASANRFVSVTAPPTFTAATNWVDITTQSRLDTNDSTINHTENLGSGTNVNSSVVILASIPANAWFMNFSLSDTISGVITNLPSVENTWIEIQDASNTVLFTSQQTVMNNGNPSVAQLAQQLSPFPANSDHIVLRWSWSGTFSGTIFTHRVTVAAVIFSDPHCPLILESALGQFTGSLPNNPNVPFDMRYQPVTSSGIPSRPRGSSFAQMTAMQNTIAAISNIYPQVMGLARYGFGRGIRKP